MTIQTAFVVQPFTLAGRRNQRLVPLPKREVQSRDDYQGYGWSAAVHPDDAQPTIDAWNAAVAERRMFLFEHRVRRRGGAWGCFSVCAIPILGADGAVREWVGVHTDVTEQRAAEAVLRESEARAQAIVNSIDQMIWSTRRTATTTTTTTVVLHTRACRMARPTARRGTACSTPTIRSAPGPSGGAACRDGRALSHRIPVAAPLRPVPLGHRPRAMRAGRRRPHRGLDMAPAPTSTT